MTPAELLLRAADKIDAAPMLSRGSFFGHVEDGKLVHDDWDGEGVDYECFCTVGAVRAAFAELDERKAHREIAPTGYPAWNAAISALKVKLKVETISDVYRWNDDEKRTKDEVAKLLRDTARNWA